MRVRAAYSGGGSYCLAGAGGGGAGGGARAHLQHALQGLGGAVRGGGAQRDAACASVTRIRRQRGHAAIRRHRRRRHAAEALGGGRGRDSLPTATLRERFLVARPDPTPPHPKMTCPSLPFLPLPSYSAPPAAHLVQ
jgi:hypothetical protein